MLFFTIFCVGVLKIVLVDLPSWILEKVGIKFTVNEEHKEFLYIICFIIGGVIGMVLGGYLNLQFAIWLGFRYGDLPSLWM